MHSGIGPFDIESGTVMFGVEVQDEIFLSQKYRWVTEARVDRFDYIDDVVFPPRTTFMIKPQEHQAIRVGMTYRPFFGSLSVSYSDSAFWQDVLIAPYSGTTDAYTLVNGSFGVRRADGRAASAVKFANLGNSDVQQHVFGDITKRQIVGELRVQLDRRQAYPTRDGMRPPSRGRRRSRRARKNPLFSSRSSCSSCPSGRARGP